MRIRLSLKQLFLFGILASPIWSIWLLASQGRPWAISALFVQLITATVLIVMCLLFGISDLFGSWIYRRRLVKRRQSPRSVPVATVSEETVGSPQAAVLPDDSQPSES